MVGVARTGLLRPFELQAWNEQLGRPVEKRADRAVQPSLSIPDGTIVLCFSRGIMHRLLALVQQGRKPCVELDSGKSPRRLGRFSEWGLLCTEYVHML